MVGDYGAIKVGRDNSISQALFDDLLQIFKKEDIEFFEYVFITKGRNIRNNVVHAFYLPINYGTTEATLVFLCKCQSWIISIDDTDFVLSTLWSRINPNDEYFV